MYDWNRANFEGLLELASALAEEPELAGLAEYCDLRERGLRRQAFEALETFLANAAQWGPALARTTALRILEIHLQTRDAHQFLSQPLLQRFLLPVLSEWYEEGNSPAEAIRWLGILSSELSLVQSALDLDPADGLARRHLVKAELSAVDYATHHLAESFFIGSEKQARASLSRAEVLLRESPNTEQVADLSAEYSTLAQMVADWAEFREGSETSFPEWCQARGRSYSWPAAFYYGDSAAQQADEADAE